ncbi:PREDICTED: protein N-terminal glutamine amidohydrolase-like [Camelina sativa]|uniref:Protein N-terminal glutamine amidohydrolase n=1 Tax=Camelina sativa TaxID=90675 RepID=A0ABM1RNY6_CAMSA|nr:PREDICTED: protein N-terminal glutamine amidohydrolase-like [Camelina sativa]
MSSVTSELVVMEATRFQHTPYYCEENVYLLCKTLCENGVADATGSDLFVVFISNEKKQVPLWHQKASRRADGIVLWDYHVICVQHFASDRRHMKEPDGSWTAQPPPYEPIVAQDGILHNLSEYIAMSGADTLSSLDPETVRTAISQKLGVVVSHTQLQDLFTKLP